MPHFWNNTNTVAVHPEEIIPNYWKNQACLSVEISRNRNNPFGVKALQRGGGKSKKLVIDFDSLANNIQEHLGDPRKMEHNLLYFYQTDSIAVDFYTSFCRPDGSYLNADEQQRYITNASVMISIMKLRTKHQTERIKMGMSLKGMNAFLCEESNSFNPILLKKLKYNHNLPTHPTRFKEALNEFETPFNYNHRDWTFNFLSIVKDVEGKRKQNARIVDDVTEAVLNGLFANISHKPTVTEIHRAYDAFLNGYAQVYNEDTGEIFEPKGFPSLSESTVRNYISKWENKAATYKQRSGDRQKYMGSFKPYHQLERPKFAGSLISVDDRNPPFKDLDGNRVWFYNCLDVASGCITAFVYGKTKDGIITEFYRQIVRNYTQWGINLPAELEAESSLNSSFKDTFLQDGYMFKNVRIEANNARGKRIERDNGILRYNIEKKREGWLARPHAKSESNQAGSKAVPMIPYENIVEGAIEDIYELNNSPHMTDKNVSRWDYFVENQNPKLEPTNWKAILPFLGYPQKSSCNTGFIKLQGKARAIAQNGEICLGEKLINVMKAIEGKEIDIYWLDDNEGNVLKALAFYDGKFICEVQEMPRYNRAVIEQTDACAAARELQSSYVSTVEGFIRHQEKALMKVNIYQQPKPAPKNGFFIPGMKQNRFTPTDPETVETIDTIDTDDAERMATVSEIKN